MLLYYVAALNTASILVLKCLHPPRETMKVSEEIIKTT